MGNVLFQQSCLPRWGWLGEVPRPSATTSSRGSPQPASESEEHTGTMEAGGEKGGGRAQPDKGPAAPPQASFLPPGVLP